MAQPAVATLSRLDAGGDGPLDKLAEAREHAGEARVEDVFELAAALDDLALVLRGGETTGRSHASTAAPERRRPLARKRRKCAGRRERARREELLRREAAVRASGVPPWFAPTAGGHRAWRGGGSGGKRPSGETAGILESFLKRRGGNGERADLGGDDAAAGFHRCSRESTVVQNQVTHVGGGAETFGASTRSLLSDQTEVSGQALPRAKLIFCPGDPRGGYPFDEERRCLADICLFFERPLRC